MKLHRDLKITQKSAYFMAQRLREAWTEGHGGMAGPVEVDEDPCRRQGEEQARQQEAARRSGALWERPRLPVLWNRATNTISAAIIENTDATTLQGFVASRAADGASVYTDQAAGYKGMPFEHEAVNHSVSEYVRDQAHTNGIESFWATLKRGYHGTFHHISPEASSPIRQ